MVAKFMRHLLAGGFTFLMLSGPSFHVALASEEGAHSLRVGDAAPDFTLKEIDGGPVQLARYNKGPVLLWFTNLCPGCQGALPDMETAYKQYSAKGVAFLAISLLGDDAVTVRAVVKKHNVTFPFLMDPKGETYLRYGGVRVPPGTCPVSPQLFIIGNGRVAYATHFPGSPEADLWRTLDALLNKGEKP